MTARGPVDEERRRAFERARLAGEDSPLETFLPPREDPRHEATLLELCCIELELARGALRVEALQRRFPELRGEAPTLRLAVEEWLARRAAGERVELEEYGARFPAGPRLVDRLRDDPELASARVEDPPARVGRYAVRGELGRGSFGRVLRARDPELGRDVALKVLRPELADEPGVVARFHREARSAARLRHPGIAAVHEVGREGARPFLVAELVEGPSLEHALQDGPLEPRRAASLVARIADALDYAHQYGVVHRDVKPANVLLRSSDEPVLTDFGLALLEGADTDLTRQGELLGTPAYMSPEQVREPERVDARSDVYSLGVLLYRSLCGRLPFEGGFSAVLRQVVEREPPALRALRPDLPRELDTICRAAMAREPMRRYASAAVMAADLRRFLAREPILAQPPGPLARALLWCRREPALAGTIALAGALLLLVGGLGLRGVLRERDRYEAERDQARANLYRALLGEARAQLEARGSGWFERGMRGVARAAELEVPGRDPRELRELAIRFHGSSEPSFRLLAEWRVEGDGRRAVALGPFGELAACSAGAELTLHARADGAELARATLDGARALDLGVHPRGHLVAVACDDGRLRVFELEREPRVGLRAAWSRELDGAPLGALAVDPARGRLALGSDAGGLWLFEAWSRDAMARPLAGHDGAVLDLDFDADGALLASCGADRRAALFDCADGALLGALRHEEPLSSVSPLSRRRLCVAAPPTYGFEWRDLLARTRSVRSGLHSGPVTVLRARGRWVYSASRDGSVLVSADEDRTLATAARDAVAVEALDVDPRGAELLALHADGSARWWELVAPRARRPLHLDHGLAFLGRRLVSGTSSLDLPRAGAPETRRLTADPVERLAVLPGEDGFLCGTRGGELRRYAPGGEQIRRWPLGQAAVVALAPHPDGARVAALDGAGRVRVLSADGGAPSAELQLGLEAPSGLSWSADGRALLVAAREGLALWEPGSGAPARALPGRAPAVRVGAEIACVASDGALVLLEPEHGDARVLAPPEESPWRALAWDADSRTLVAATARGRPRCWRGGDWSASAPMDALPFEPARLHVGAGGRFLLAWSGDSYATAVLELASGRRVAWALCDRTLCGAFDDARGELLLGTERGAVMALALEELERAARESAGDGAPRRIDRLSTRVPGGHVTTVWGVAASPDGERHASCDHLGVVKLWRAGELAWSRDAHQTPAWSLAFDRAGERLASTALDLALWDAASGRELLRVPPVESLQTGVVFLPEKRLATCSLDGRLRVRSLTDGALVGAPWEAGEALHALALDAGERWLAAAAHGGRVHLWELTRGPVAGRAPDRSLEGRSPVWSLAFDARGELLASGDEAGEVTLWRTDAWQRLVALGGDARMVRGLAFSPDGELLAGSCFAGPGFLWELSALREELAALGLDW